MCQLASCIYICCECDMCALQFAWEKLDERSKLCLPFKITLGNEYFSSHTFPLFLSTSGSSDTDDAIQIYQPYKRYRSRSQLFYFPFASDLHALYQSCHSVSALREKKMLIWVLQEHGSSHTHTCSMHQTENLIKHSFCYSWYSYPYHIINVRVSANVAELRQTIKMRSCFHYYDYYFYQFW